MVQYQSIIRNALYPLDRWLSGDQDELAYLHEFERTQYASPERLQELQFTRLRRVVAIAYEHCPFYQARFREAGIHPDDLRRLEDVRWLPILEKRDIQRCRDEMIARNYPSQHLIENMTGGSTGAPLSFFVTRDRMRSRAAATWRHNGWAGWKIGDRYASLWGAARDAPGATWKSRIRKLLINRTIFCNSAQITEKGLRDFDVALKSFRPSVILAYAKSIVLFAAYLQANRIEPHQPKSIVVSAEVLEPAERELVERVFGCRVFNRYGCREVSVIASECDQHDGLHLMAEGLHVEVVEGGKAAEVGKSGSLIVTDLLNVGMPFIRYRIGDLAAMVDCPCPCGRGLPRIKNIAGRVTDFLVTADGRLVSGAALTVAVVARRPSLGQVQIVQDSRDRVLYRIAIGDGPMPSQGDLEFLRSETRHYLGDETEIDYEVVDSIAPSPSGKHVFCQSVASCDFLDLGPLRAKLHS